jgi:pyochelin synthetase
MQDLLTKTVRAGVRLELNGEDLRVVGPANALTQELREALRANKDALIERLRQMAQRAGGEGDALPELTVAPQHRHEPFPLTDVQHAYWMGRHDLVELGQVATHFYFELDGRDLDCARLEGALDQLIRRHDMLRAVVDASGQQRVLEDVGSYRIELNDLRTVDLANGQASVLRTRDTMSHAVRPASQWPLFEVKASLLPQGHVRLHISLDMLIMDAWSMFVLFQEWHELYEQPQRALAPIGLNYRDYVMAERSLLGGPAHERARSYWNARIDTLPSAPELPIRASDSVATVPRFSRRRHHVEASRWTRLRERARAEGLTPSGLLLAAYAEVLTRWSFSAHYTLNLTLFNRLPVHPDVFKLVGDFTSLTMLEVDHRAAQSSFLERATALQRQLMQDLEHREFSGVQVLREWTQRQRTGMYAAMPVVFTSALVLGGGEAGQDASLVERFGPMVYGVSQTPQVWLDNQVMEVAGELVFNWDAVDDLFEPGVLDAMFTAYRQVLEQLADDPASWTRGAVIPQPQALRSVAEPAQAAARVRPLHAGLLEHARRTPDALAVIAHDRQLSYRELLTESAQVALWLKERQVGPGQLVAVLTRKGWEQPVAVLGTLLAGAAYMPIDAGLPLQRQRELLELGRVSCILTQADCSPLLLAPEWAVDFAVLALHPQPRCAEEDAALAEAPLVAADQLAYVIFTSGTTGQPKGVMMDHAAVVNTVHEVNQRLALRSEDRILGVSSLSFDLSVYDIFGAIEAGAALVLPDPAQRLDASHWRDLIERHRVTIWNSAPQLMRMLMDVGAGAATAVHGGLRAVLLSGDWIAVDLPERILALHPGARIMSLGGATEAAIWSIWYPISQVQPGWTSIPYGKSMPSQSVQVLNSRFEPCPEQVRGRIYIGGKGLSQGYWGDAQRTSQRFVHSPLSGERLYDTGDLGRTMADGNIEFLGRDDDQVKIRGHRVEPGEVAAALRQHADVKEAVVLAAGERLQRQLVAYVELADGPMQALGRCEGVDGVLPLAQSLLPDLGASALRPIDDGIRTAWSRLDGYYLESVLVAFRRLGVAAQPHDLLTLQDMLKRGVVDRYQRWLLRAFEALRESGYLRRIGTWVYQVGRAWPTADLSAFSTEVQHCLIEVFDFSREDAEWFTHAAESLHDILTERVHSAEIYTADATARVYQKLFPDNHAQLSAVCAAVLRTPRQGPISVLEVGAGLGSATQHVLPVMPHDARYVFTDISDFFLNRAEKLFGHQHAGIEFMRYDVDLPPEFQGLERNHFDLVLASSMLHDVQDVASALEHLAGLLKPGGQLVILEETRFFSSFDLHMGLQQGFDGFTDTGLRADHCLLSNAQWEQTMREAGFSDVLVVSEVGSAIEYLGFSVIVATAPLKITRLDQRAVRDYLGARLPEYMLPAHVVHMPCMPVTGNGKIDYKALPAVPATLVSQMQHVSPSNALEQALQHIWTAVLKVSDIGVTDNFFDLGGDSLIATHMVREIRQVMAVDLEIHEFLYNPTVQALAELIASKRTGGAALSRAAAEVFPSLMDSAPQDDLQGLLAQLEPLDFNAAPAPVRALNTVLLTGATGWLGAHLLRELLDQSQARIVCPVRASSAAQAQERIRANLARQGLVLSDAQARRISAIPADLALPRFGLDGSAWLGLCQDVDRIFHAAASVDTVGDYASLRAANVLPIVDLLRLALAHHAKPVVFASTLAVCIRRSQQGFVIRTEETLSADPDGLVVGYAQSKWVAEQLLWAASARGLEVQLFRIPHVLPAMHGPELNQNNILGSLLSVAAKVPALPDWGDSRVDGICVDRIAPVMVCEGLQAAPASAVIHLVADAVASLPEVIRDMHGGSASPALPVIAREEWIDLCRQAMQAEEHASNVILARLLAPTDGGVLLETMFGPAKVATGYLEASSARIAQAALLPEAGYWPYYGGAGR